MPHLEMKAECEKCKAPLEPESESYICSYECTFCANCASRVARVCPNCGGELVRRPLRSTLIAVAPNTMKVSLVKRGVLLVCAASIAAWMFVALSGGASMYEFERSLGHKVDMRMVFVLPLINYAIFAFLTPWVFFLARRYPLQRNNWRSRAVLYAAGGFAFSVAHVALRALVYPVWDSRTDGFTSAVWNSHTHLPQIQWILIRRLSLYNTADDILSTYLAIVLVAHAVWYYQSFRERETRASQLETQLTKARLKVLKSQLQPHFLFNTMHSISALMLTDVPSADKMITRLSDFLRISLDNDEVQFTTLNRELEFVNSYLEIEKVRFEERLRLIFNIPSETRDAQVPHLFLQPIVENAIQHGISRRPGGGTLSISAARSGDELRISVRNDGPGLTETERNRLAGGVGLRATRERLQTIYGDDHTFDICSPASGGVEAEFRLPFRVEERPTLNLLESFEHSRAG